MTSVAAAAAAAALDTLAQLMPGAPRLLLLVIPLTVLVLIGAAQLLQEEDRASGEGATVVVIGAPTAATELDIAGLAEALSTAELRHLVAQLSVRASATASAGQRRGDRRPAPRHRLRSRAGTAQPRTIDTWRAGEELMADSV